MKARYGIASIIGILAIIVVPLYLLADGHIVYPPTDERLANIEGTLGIAYPTATSEATATDVPATATAVEPTATDVPPTATEPEPTATHDHGDEPATAWHAPDGHEHGDAPQAYFEAWSIEQFGHGIIYGGDEATPNEDLTKHNAYKGFATSLKGVNLYFRMHAQSNPHGRAAQFHSYEVYARDASGNISFWQGWTNCGDPNQPGKRQPRSQGDNNNRPQMLVVDQAAWNAGIRFEQWYCSSGAASWDFGWTIGETTTIWNPGEHLNDPHDQANWQLAPNQTYGLTRRIEAAWYGPNSQVAPNRGNPPKNQWFWTTQFFTPVSGPNDPACGAQVPFNGSTITVLCLPQYIASTMPAVEFPGNAVQKQFPGSPNLSLPN